MAQTQYQTQAAQQEPHWTRKHYGDATNMEHEMFLRGFMYCYININ